MKKRGRLFVISGPSGVGKGTIVSAVVDHLGEAVRLSVSATTRAPREGDIDGISYYFLEEEEFLARVGKGEFLEYASVHENYYGTPKPPVEGSLEAGCDVILEIDVQGAMQVRDNFQDAVYIFILPPSMKVLRERLVGRGTESAESVEIRMGKAMQEIEYLDRYDYRVVNDDLETAVDDVLAIIRAEGSRVRDDAEPIIMKYREEL